MTNLTRTDTNNTDSLFLGKPMKNTLSISIASAILALSNQAIAAPNVDLEGRHYKAYSALASGLFI
ncbi:hypothetical protein O9929_21430 [Vibrio lentus]|nr:hypothetical protein [Vibrio lentus]